MTAHRGIRYRADIGPNGEGGFEMRCASCAADKGVRYWPLSLEFWLPQKGMSRCKACWNAYQRRQEKRRRVHRRTDNMRAYQREWAARRREQQRQAEGRGRYERRKAA